MREVISINGKETPRRACTPLPLLPIRVPNVLTSFVLTRLLPSRSSRLPNRKFLLGGEFTMKDWRAPTSILHHPYLPWLTRHFFTIALLP